MKTQEYGFTEGYLFGNLKKNLMSGDLSKHQGIYIGKVASSTGSGRHVKIRLWIKIRIVRGDLSPFNSQIIFQSTTG